MSFNPYEFDRDYSQAQGETQGQYTAKTFLWMFLGLMVTFAVALTMYLTGGVLVVFSIPGIHFILVIAELVTVLYLAARVQKLSVGAARGLFLAYAVLNGLMFSTLFFVYRLDSMILVFGLTALYFGAMAAYGYLTHTDLSGLRPILIFGLIFLLLFWVLSLFLNMSAFEQVICLIGIAVFMGCTAYDTQKIKSYYQYYAGYPDLLEKAAIYSALQLYLDFINIFLYLLRYMGKNRR